jgi:hypothetical protein
MGVGARGVAGSEEKGFSETICSADAFSLVVP